MFPFPSIGLNLNRTFLSQWLTVFVILSLFQQKTDGFSEMTHSLTVGKSGTKNNVATSNHPEWINSQNLTQWMTPLDLCLLANDSTLPVEEMMYDCELKIKAQGFRGQFLPTRCRAGNSWPSKGGFCAAKDIPYAQRENFRRAIRGYDDPTQQPLRTLFSKLSKERGALLLVGDSVMQQFYGALACELEREGVWTDPSAFKNTDELRHVQVDPTTGANVIGLNASAIPKVPIRFTPIYHFVNGKYDRVPNASMHALHKAVDSFLENYDSLYVFINIGLHYVSNPIAKFDRPAYQSQMTDALQYLHDKKHGMKSKNKIVRIVWRETSAQHFPTYNGYWPGVKYATGMDVKCVPVKDSSPEGDWRNSDIRTIISKNQFNVTVVPFYQQTLPLWGQHVNGHLRDCTHLCWTPMLYQTLFHRMTETMTTSS